MRKNFDLIGWSLWLLLGCYGNIQSPTDRGPGDSDNNTQGAPILDRAEVAPLTRLNREELSHTLRDLLGLKEDVSDKFPEDAVGASGFYSPGILSALESTYLLEVMERISQSLASQMPKLVGCDPTKGETTCARQFIETFGRRAYRRPLEGAEVNDLLNFFNTARTELKYPFYNAAQLTLEVMLQTPHFLYHRESGARATADNGVIRLDGYGVASRLSYFLWTTMPDDELFAAAENGELSTPAGIERQTTRMMADPKFKDTLKLFHFQWLGINDLKSVTKDPMLFPQFTPELLESMEKETLEFVTDVVNNDGKFKTLLTAQFSYLDADLAKLYGLPSDGFAPGALKRVDLTGKNRSGLLTQPSFLAWGATSTESLPPRRGVKILEQFLCQVPPPPPEGVAFPPPAAQNQTNRQRFEEHLKNGCAKACHGLIDPLGFSFENYDAIGRYRSTDNGQPVDASGSVRLSAQGTEHTYKTAEELNTILANSPEVASCVARKWLRYGLGRMDQPGDGLGLKTAVDGFLASDTDLRKLISLIAQSRAFVERLPDEGETYP